MSKTTQNMSKLLAILSNSQGVTIRALRTAREQNPKKFEREAIGSLLQSAGYSFHELLELIMEEPTILDLRKSLEKIRAIENLIVILGSNYVHNEFANSNDACGLIGLIELYFKNFTNNKGAKFHFLFKNKVEHGMKVADVLEVAVSDRTSTIDNPSRKESIIISSSLEDTIQNIENYFPEMKEASEKKLNRIVQTIRISKEDYPKEKNPLHKMFYPDLLKNEAYIQEITLNFENKAIFTPMLFKNFFENTYTYFNIHGLEYRNEEDFDAAGFYKYLVKVIKKCNLLDNEDVKTNLVSLDEELAEGINEDELAYAESEVFYRLTNLVNIIFESISEGLSKSFEQTEDAIREHYCLFSKKIKLSYFAKSGWEEKEDNVFTKTIES